MISQANATLHSLMFTKWFTEELLSWQWWGIIGFLTFSYILCFTLMNKKRLTETILFGSLVSVFAVVMDVILSNMNAFLYNVNLVPMIPSIFIYDITALPMYFMLIFQHATLWKKYSIWITLASAIMGFIFTPLMVKLGYLQFIWWNYFLAFLVIAFIGFLAKAVMSLIFYVEESYRAEQKISFSQATVPQPAMRPSGVRNDRRSSDSEDS
ncbi:hypothetical protein GJ688_18530 [Heliobacillus mobilis]|uniref:Uncharacterized protein n=1 Tax=Heliobacterium mobile TaxID=28064 RepID=A0A6I3SSA4_HELMO|nr:hypothetical protein [Heliobacterium mobile]